MGKFIEYHVKVKILNDIDVSYSFIEDPKLIFSGCRFVLDEMKMNSLSKL